jgi:hypothetical protein
VQEHNVWPFVQARTTRRRRVCMTSASCCDALTTRRKMNPAAQIQDVELLLAQGSLVRQL